MRKQLERLLACALHYAKPFNYTPGQNLGCNASCNAENCVHRKASPNLNAPAMSTPAASKHTKFSALPIRSRMWHPMASIAIGLSLLAPGFSALPKEPTLSQTTSSDKINSKKNGAKVTHHRSPSEETRAERDRRLYRECKGMPNAGACLGYTRK